MSEIRSLVIKFCRNLTSTPEASRSLPLPFHYSRPSRDPQPWNDPGGSEQWAQDDYDLNSTSSQSCPLLEHLKRLLQFARDNGSNITSVDLSLLLMGGSEGDDSEKYPSDDNGEPRGVPGLGVVGTVGYGGEVDAVMRSSIDPDIRDKHAFLYIVVVLLFYSSGIVIAMVMYLKREKKEMEVERACEKYSQFSMREPEDRTLRRARVQKMVEYLKQLECERVARQLSITSPPPPPLSSSTDRDRASSLTSHAPGERHQRTRHHSCVPPPRTVLPISPVPSRTPLSSASVTSRAPTAPRCLSSLSSAPPRVSIRFPDDNDKDDQPPRTFSAEVHFANEREPRPPVSSSLWRGQQHGATMSLLSPRSPPPSSAGGSTPRVAALALVHSTGRGKESDALFEETERRPLLKKKKTMISSRSSGSIQSDGYSVFSVVTSVSAGAAETSASADASAAAVADDGKMSSLSDGSCGSNRVGGSVRFNISSMKNIRKKSCNSAL